MNPATGLLARWFASIAFAVATSSPSSYAGRNRPLALFSAALCERFSAPLRPRRHRVRHREASGRALPSRPPLAALPSPDLVAALDLVRSPMGVIRENW